MDLSHWDVVTFFNRDQIAHLLAGVDPNGGPYPRLVENKVKLYRGLVSIAIDNALKHAQQYVMGLAEPPEVIAPDIFEFDSWGDELPSYEIRCSVADVLSDPENNQILRATDPNYSEKFIRDDVHAWADFKEFEKGYRFDGIANDRVPDFDQCITADTEMSDLESAFDMQLEALSERYWEYIKHLKITADAAKLNRIGSWQRITMLDRLAGC